MAKVTPIDSMTYIHINPKSKNMTYEFNTETSANFTTDFVDDKGNDVTGYEAKYNNFAFKKDNDLIVTTIFTSEKGSIKKVNTTFKNFFADESKNYMVYYKTFKDYVPMWNETSAYWGGEGYPIKPNTAVGTHGLYDYQYNPNATRYLLDTTGDDYTQSLSTADSYVYDEKGNDTYRNKYAHNNYIYDMAGNDDYGLEGTFADPAGMLYVSDYKGKDSYLAGGKGSILQVQDYAGNDNYELDPMLNFLIDDYKGNDTYLIRATAAIDTSNKLKQNVIMEWNGNDKYTLTEGAKAQIIDEGGKDTYDIKLNSSSHVFISDAGKGNDTITVKNGSNISYEYFEAWNDSGNETYNIESVYFDKDSYDDAVDGGDAAVNDEYGNDKYNLKDVDYIALNDTYGNDTYNVVDSEGMTINNIYGNDKYNLSVSGEMAALNDIYIYDCVGKDVYTVNKDSDDYAGKIQIKDYDDKSSDKYNVSYTTDLYIYDWGGKDTYNIAQSSAVITDYEADNDTYNFNELSLIDGWGSFIDDRGGKKDSLSIKNISNENIIYMTDYDANQGYNGDQSLVLLDLSNRGYIKIHNFYSDYNDDGIYDDFGNGQIETIKAGKATLKDVPDADCFTASLRNSVAGWLSSNNFDDVMEAIRDGSDAQVQQLAQLFQAAV